MERIQTVVRIIIGAIVALVLLASPSYAQVTGTVTGAVQDTQNGRIPGAAVSLTSETRGTKVPDVMLCRGLSLRVSRESDS